MVRKVGKVQQILFRERKAIEELQAQQVHRALRVLQEILVPMEQEVHRELPVHKVFRV